MSHRQRAVRHEDESSDDEQFYDTDASAHGDETKRHDQIVLTQGDEGSRPSSTHVDRDDTTPSGGQRPWSYSSAADSASGGTSRSSVLTASTSSDRPAWPYHHPPSSAPNPADPLHINTPHATTFSSSYYTSDSSNENLGSQIFSIGSQISASSATTLSTPDLSSSVDGAKATGAKHSYSRPHVRGWQSSYHGLQTSLGGALDDSPISPLTIREFDPPYAASQNTDTTDFASEPSVGRSPLSQGYPETDFEGFSLPPLSFPRPRSHRSSDTSSTATRQAPGLLTSERRGHASSLFIDPLAPQSADLSLGLPSIRHIMDSDDRVDDDIKLELPTLVKDDALVNHLEILQRDAAECWKKAQGVSGEKRENLVNDLVSRLWQTSVSYLAELLRSHKTLRQLATDHRVSLGEIDKLRQYSQDTEGEVFERERHLSLDLDGLKEENRKLRKQLALRDLSVAKSLSNEDDSLRIGSWIQNQAFVHNSSFQVNKNLQPLETLEEEIKPDMAVGTIPSEELKDWPDMMPPLRERPWADANKRESWEPNHKDTVEMLQKIQQLRDDIEHERYLREASQELALQLEKELDLAHGLTAADEPSAVDDAQSATAKRIAEIVGSRAALKTSQKNYEKAQAETAFLQKKCDELEGKIAENDHRILMLQRDLEEVQNELNQERGELTDAMLRIEDMEAQLADSEKQLQSKTAELSRLEYQVGVLVADLNTAQASLEDLSHKNAALEEKNYDLVTDNVYKLQCAEHEETLRKLKEAELEEIKDELAEERATRDVTRSDLEDYIHDLEDAIAEDKAEQEELRKQIEKDRATVAELEVTVSLRDDRILAQGDTIHQLKQSNKSLKDTNKQLAEYLKSLRGEEGQRKFEALRKRCRKLQEQRAAWRHEIREMASRGSRAEQRYRQEHRALTKAHRDLEKLRQQRNFDAERERQLLARIAFLERECERLKLALQDIQLRVASAVQIEQSHEREIDDVEGILQALGEHDTAKDGKPASVVDFSHTALPPPPIIQEKVVTRMVEHHHSEACFCSLIEYWFPGALESVLPRRRDTDDSGYGSGSLDGDDDSPGLGHTIGSQGFSDADSLPEDVIDSEVEEAARESAAAPHTVFPQSYGPATYSPGSQRHDADSPTDSAYDAEASPRTGESRFEQDSDDDLMSETEQRSTSSNKVTSSDSPTGDDYGDNSAIKTGHGGWDKLSLRGGAGSPEDTASEASSGYEEKMATFKTMDDGWGGVEPQEPVKKDEDAASETSSGYYERQQDENTPHNESEGDLPQHPVQQDEAMAATIEPESSREARPASFEEITDSGEELPGPSGSQGHDNRGSPQPLDVDPAVGLTNRSILDLELDEVDEYIEQLMQGNPSNAGSRSTGPSSVKASAAQEATSQSHESEQQQEAQQQEAQQQEAQKEEAQQGEAQQGEAQQGEAQSPQATPRPHRLARRVTFVDEDEPIASLLDLIDSCVPATPNEPDDQTEDDTAFYTRQARHYYHGHTTTDGPFEGPIHFLCQLLTALTWLVMLILSQPGHLLSTIAILASYFILPLGFMLRLALYYIRLPLYHIKRLIKWILRSPPPEQNSSRPAWPALGRPSAAGMVSSAVSLMVVFFAIALRALMYEREIWLRPNRWTDAYLRDIVDQRPYPWWSPVDVDFRLAALEWIGWKANVLAFGERYLKTW
ncbi:hypothetical protein BR93DRAFT_926996 [Coniochaeta sp. PMI_546]|nr:hypothetical protein BR93DRAFT_926996 [Coniochaeta sp. PMI_546]